MTMKLHNFFRSSTSTRVRAALNLKELPYEYVPYVIRNGQTRAPDYLAKNPQGLVPTLEREDGRFLTQSLAILEWLEEPHPEPHLLPDDQMGRARVRALSYMIACEIHPLNNLRVLFRIRDQFGADETAQKEWFTHWVTLTFDALEVELSSSEKTGSYCHGDTPTIAGIFGRLDGIAAFRNAAPPNQPDAA